MGTIVRVAADRWMGHLGLFLIGAISWVVDRMGSSREPARRARARHVSPHSARRAEA
jgi:hypothetical protein